MMSMDMRMGYLKSKIYTYVGHMMNGQGVSLTSAQGAR